MLREEMKIKKIQTLIVIKLNQSLQSQINISLITFKYGTTQILNLIGI